MKTFICVFGFALFFVLCSFVAVSVNIVALFINVLADDSNYMNMLLFTILPIAYVYLVLLLFKSLFECVLNPVYQRGEKTLTPFRAFMWLIFSFLLPVAIISSINFLSGSSTLIIKSMPDAHVIILAFCSAIFPGVVEELCYRWFLYKKLRDASNKSIGVVFSGAVFGVLHFNQVESVNDMSLLLVSAISVSFLFCSIYEISKSIIPCMIVHVIWDFITDEGIFERVTTISTPSDSIFNLYISDGYNFIVGKEFGIETSAVTIFTYIMIAFIFSRRIDKAST